MTARVAEDGQVQAANRFRVSNLQCERPFPRLPDRCGKIPFDPRTGLRRQGPFWQAIST